MKHRQHGIVSSITNDVPIVSISFFDIQQINVRSNARSRHDSYINVLGVASICSHSSIKLRHMLSKNYEHVDIFCCQAFILSRISCFKKFPSPCFLAEIAVGGKACRKSQRCRPAQRKKLICCSLPFHAVINNTELGR